MRNRYLKEFRAIFSAKKFKKILLEEGLSREFSHTFTDGKNWYAVIHSEGNRINDSTDRLSRDYLVLKKKYFHSQIKTDKVYDVKV